MSLSFTILPQTLRASVCNALPSPILSGLNSYPTGDTGGMGRGIPKPGQQDPRTHSSGPTPAAGSSGHVPSQAPRTRNLRNIPPMGKRSFQVPSWTLLPAALVGRGTPSCHAPPSPQRPSKTLTNSWMSGTNFSPSARTTTCNLLVKQPMELEVSTASQLQDCVASTAPV